MIATISDVRLLPLATGGTEQPVDVEIDEVITAIRPAGSAERRGDAIDGQGGFLLPGLIDTHVHLGTVGALHTAVRAGLTTVVELGTHPDELIAAQRREPGAPSIVSAGSAASAPGSTQIARMGFPVESGVRNADDAERFLDWRVGHGSELIKIIIEDPATTDVPALEPPTLAALVRGAHRRGLLTVAHVVTAAAFDRGLDAGVDVLTHAPLDRPVEADTVRKMADSGTVASPTLIMMRTMAQARLGARAEAAFAHALESVRRMHEGGVRITVGTDANEIPVAPVPLGPSLHDELQLLQQAGLSVSEVIRGATEGAAESLRLADRGRVAEGLRADLIMVDSDPLHDLAVLREPTAVWVKGALRQALY